MEVNEKAIKLIQDTAVDAAKATLVELGSDGREALVNVGGKVTAYAIAPKPRQHHVGSLADLANYAIASTTGKTVVWHDEKCCVLVLDDVDRRDLVLFTLIQSPAWIALKRLETDKPALNQRDFINLLRLVLDVDAAVVSVFRKLTWKAATETKGEISRTKESLGKSIMGEVSGVSEIPEHLDIQVPIYETLGETTEYLVRCLVEPDTVNERLQLVPAPGEMQRLLDRHQCDIQRRLEEAFSDEDNPKAIPVYYGRP